MTPNSHSFTEDWYHALASFPLPEAAVVIDVRQHAGKNLLLAHLGTELTDLAAEMGYYHVPGWSQLAECITILQVDAITPYTIPLDDDTHSPFAMPSEHSDFVVITQTGKEIALQGHENLVKFLGMEVIDAVRTLRIKASVTGSQDGMYPLVDVGGTRLSTVRVFFLVDMDEPASLTKAATYADWFKTWAQQEHGQKRSHRGDLIHSVVVCMNAGASYYDILLQTLGHLPDRATDTVILLQKYSDDEAALKEVEQITQVELLVYTLLLRWPDVFWRRIDDPVQMQDHFVGFAKTLPWPTYMIGLSSFEYSAHWSARWLDYGVARKLLEVLTDSRKVEPEQQAVKANIKKWLDTWWLDLRAIVPDTLIGDIGELQAIESLHTLAHSSLVSRSTPLTIQQNLAAFRQQIDASYTGLGATNLQKTIAITPVAILAQVKWMHERVMTDPEAEQGVLNESYGQMLVLYDRMRQFLGLHFQGAWGAIPRGIGQLSTLTANTQTISEMAQRPLDFGQYNEQIGQQIGQAEEIVTKQSRMWRLPLVGLVLRSTVASWLVMLVAAALLLFGIDWNSLLLKLFSNPSFFGASLQPHVGVSVWGLRVVLLLLLLGGEWYYLTWRNKQLRRLCRKIDSGLRDILQQQLNAIGDVIAARVALELLQWADLYLAGKNMSSYEQRLRDFEQLSKRIREQTDAQQELADTRLEGNLNKPQKQATWDFRTASPGLRTRQESIAWSQIEDAFLQSCQGLTANLDAVNLLAEFLLRRLGTESPSSLLEDIWQKQRWLASKGSESRFQAVSTFLVALLLSASVVQSEIADVLPLLQEYVSLRDLYEEKLAASGDETLDLQTTVREIMLAQARGKRLSPALRIREKQAPAVLVSWVNRQRQGTPQLQEVFASNDILEHIEEMTDKMQPSSVVDDLRRRGTLQGYPDELSGEDYLYLFVAPGAAGEAFSQSLDLIQHAQVRQELFPDREKLIYLHIHQIRQLLPSSDQETAEGKQQQSTESR